MFLKKRKTCKKKKKSSQSEHSHIVSQVNTQNKENKGELKCAVLALIQWQTLEVERV